jgi:hypothetical protein
MDKAFIVEEIKKATAARGGKPPGRQTFEIETGIRISDWCGKYWRNRGEALQEAGFAPNQFQSAYDVQYLLEQFINLLREIRRFPVQADLKIKAREDKAFPSHTTFARLGRKVERVKKVVDYCKSRNGFEDVLQVCPNMPDEGKAAPSVNSRETEIGFVYLLKSGRYYKIGKSNSVGRREREPAIQLPDKANCIHSIRTDDPHGIEVYWHNRFANKRKNGEWFELDAGDVAVFKRRKFM